jgi:hypothetical protein
MIRPRRWDIHEGEGGQWDMVVTATREVEAGEQLLLSYGERPNDDFFLHYVGPPWGMCNTFA